MTPFRLLQTAIRPALAELASLGIPDAPEARRFILAIALQESGVKHRRQVVAGGAEAGPAVSYWQFEKGGGCRGVMTHPASAKPAAALCALYDVSPTPDAVWQAMQFQDVLAAGMARLLVYTLPHRLPATAADGWDQYIAVWRPGKPRPAEWGDNWNVASLTQGVRDA